MQERHLFEYAVIRVVPQVEREEFVNVGVILYCAPQKFLQCILHIDESRLKAVNPKLDVDEVKEHIESFQQICKGGKDGGAIGKLSLAERFRWLTAARSTIVQTSKVHPGLTNNPDETLKHLFEQLVFTEA